MELLYIYFNKNLSVWTQKHFNFCFFLKERNINIELIILMKLMLIYSNLKNYIWGSFKKYKVNFADKELAREWSS